MISNIIIVINIGITEDHIDDNNSNDVGNNPQLSSCQLL